MLIYFTFVLFLIVADVENDKRSIQRKLDSSLVLVINEKLGNEFKWVLPQAAHKEGESLRQVSCKNVILHLHNQLPLRFTDVNFP